MRLSRVWGFLVTGVVSAGVLIGPCTITANADTDVDAMVYTGVIDNLPSPVPPVDDGVLGLGVLFPYDVAGNCPVFASSDDLPSVSTVCTFAGNGTYLNVVCGTGVLSGTIDVASTTDTLAVNYVTVVVAGIGVTDVLVGAGIINLVPTNSTSGGCITAPVTSFNVTGAMAMIG